MKSRNKHKGLIMTLCMLALLFSGGMTVVKAETCVDVIPDQALADRFERFTVTGITTPLPGPDPNPAGFPGAAFLRAGDLGRGWQKGNCCHVGIGRCRVHYSVCGWCCGGF